MKSFRADYVFPVYADPIKDGIVTVDDYGKITAVSDNPADHAPQIETLSGIICPGFVNAHCHVELSHLKDKVAPGTGLIAFIQNLQSLRNTDHSIIEAAALQADEDMHNNGIVAVGDISNSAVTAGIKAKSKLYYHTFVEIFSFLPGRAGESFNGAITLLDAFKPQSCSITPHAPYSVSKELFRLIKGYTDKTPNLLSMHNQECEDENKFFRYKLGGFIDLYKHFGIDIDFFKPQARNSLQSILPLFSSRQPVLLVHNTCTNLKDIYFIKRFDKKVNWCFCPNANLHIESKLPKMELFVGQGNNITLGTDSLASNSKLCILSEMRTLQQHFPSLETERLITWGTRNGAEFLGIDKEKGTLEPGKTPGLNLISGLDGINFTAESRVRPLI